MLDITNLYAYRIEELAVGIVKAESYEDAREKVKAAYLKHNDCFDQLLRDMVNNRLSSDKAGNDTTPETGNADTLKADSGSAE